MPNFWEEELYFHETSEIVWAKTAKISRFWPKLRKILDKSFNHLSNTFSTEIAPFEPPITCV